MDHKTSPLPNMKMLEAKPICKLMDTWFKNNPHENHQQRIIT